MQKIVAVLFCIGSVLADVSHLQYDQQHYHQQQKYYEEYEKTTTTTPPPPPHPYHFSYSAGRFPGHIDRTHSEVSDGSGVVKGAFSYVDPAQQIRTVEYVADKTGFYPSLSHEPRQTEAVRKATERHLDLFNRIAERNSNPHASIAASVPRESEAVARAKDHHLALFEKIAADHARIGAEQEAARIAFEATSVRNDLNDDYYNQQRYQEQPAHQQRYQEQPAHQQRYQEQPAHQQYQDQQQYQQQYYDEPQYGQKHYQQHQ